MGNNVTYNIPFFPFIDFSLHSSQNFMGHFYASILIFVINFFISLKKNVANEFIENLFILCSLIKFTL